MAKDGKTSAHTTFIGDVLKVGVLLIDIVAHLVGEFNEVEFMFVKSLINNRIVMVNIDIIFVWNKDNFFRFHD